MSADRVLVQVRLPRALVRQIDHARIDREIKSRQGMIEVIVREWLMDDPGRVGRIESLHPGGGR